MKYFNVLNQEEIDLLGDAFSWILLLLSLDSGRITIPEQNEAAHTLKVRGYEENHLFYQFYDQVSSQFDVRTESWKDRIGLGADARQRYEELIAKLNPTLAKLSPPVGRRMYKDYLTFAHRIANASGGFMGFGKISKSEKAIIGLPMLTPILPTEEEE